MKMMVSSFLLTPWIDSDDEEDEEKPNEPLDHPQQQPLS